MSLAHEILPNKDLRLVLGAAGKQMIKAEDLLHKPGYNGLNRLLEAAHYLDNGWQLVDGNEVPGALISAPVISNDSRCWWFPDYAIKSEIGTLYMTGEVIFTLAGEE